MRSHVEKIEKSNNKKIVIKDKTKFLTFIAIALICVGVLICFIVATRKIEIDENTNISELNVEKYSEEIKEEYEQEGKDSKFMEDWNSVQDRVGMYLIENYPTDQTKANEFINDINETLKSGNWEKLSIERPNVWNGTWSIDENGNVNFKFASEEIEPTWCTTLSDQGYIILN